MLSRFWIFGPAVGALVSTAITAIATTRDWLENPSGIFRDPAGTNWKPVLNTAISWWVPTFVWVAIFAAAAHLAWSGVLRLRKR